MERGGGKADRKPAQKRLRELPALWPNNGLDMPKIFFNTLDKCVKVWYNGIVRKEEYK